MEACQGLHVRKRKEVKKNWGDYPRKILPAKLGDRKLLVLGCSLAGYILSFISLSQSWVLYWSVKKARKAKQATLGGECIPFTRMLMELHPANPSWKFPVPPSLLDWIEPSLLFVIFLHVPSWGDWTLGLALAAMASTLWHFLYVRQETLSLLKVPVFMSVTWRW